MVLKYWSLTLAGRFGAIRTGLSSDTTTVGLVLKSVSAEPT